MKKEFILAYRELEKYIESEEQSLRSWQETMVNPFWDKLSKWAPFDVSFLKPKSEMDKEKACKQFSILSKIDWNGLLDEFEKIEKALPDDDEDTMYIGIYPSETDIKEGVYGTSVWGSLIFNINASTAGFEKWIPFIFAHEYHHKVWGRYWYEKRKGAGLDNSFIEKIITEGQADAFASSIYPDMKPSWQYGVSIENEHLVWNKMKEVLLKDLQPEEFEKYMFGCEEIGIPSNAGYYFGIKIINKYLERNPLCTFNELIKISPKDIYSDVVDFLDDRK